MRFRTAGSSSEGTERAASPGRAAAHVGLREATGEAIGRWWAPAVATVSRVRKARMFHPSGHTFVGRCEPVEDSSFAALADRLEGRVLARCSSALWRAELPWLDVLGIGLRIRPGRGPALDHQATRGDQDLLFATIRSPLTMFASPFTTDARDITGNQYWAVSPFLAEPIGRVKLRLRPVAPVHARGSRSARLRAAVDAGRAAWWLEARRTLTVGWHPVARIVLQREAAIDQAALRFDPFRTGLGIEPVGLVHAIRRAAYAASQQARPH
ncbi:MAG: hypothetical protein JWP01_3178 [Myxococcales bacterium]|nr:hypothetical protein [Myxococcales bacterium]